MGVVRAQGQFLGVGANRGGVGLRNGLGGRAMVQRLNVNSSMPAAPVNLTMASDATPLPLPGQAQGGTVATTEASTLQVAPADAPEDLERWCRFGAWLGGLPVVGKTANKVVNFSNHPVWENRVCDTFDWYAPEYQHHHTLEELCDWFREAGYDDLVVLP